MIASSRPSVQLPKKMLVKEWLHFFGERSFQHPEDIKNSGLSNFSKKAIEIGCNWTVENFALLDLGGNMRWHTASRKVAGLVDRKKWSDEAEERLVSSIFIHETRWADEL